MSEFMHQATDQTDFPGEGGGEHDPAVAGLGLPPDPDLDLMVDGGPKKSRSGALVLIVVVGLAIGSLLAMRSLAKPGEVQASTPSAERTVKSFLSDAASIDSIGSAEDQRRVLDVLQIDPTEKHVNLTDVQKNPFVIDQGLPVAGGETLVDTGLSAGERRDQITKAAEQLHLKMVMMGAEPLANINGRVLRRNQIITILSQGSSMMHKNSVDFRVAEITRNTVKLVAEDKGLDLKFETVLRLKQY